MKIKNNKLYSNSSTAPLDIHLPVVGVGVVQGLQQAIPQDQARRAIGVLRWSLWAKVIPKKWSVVSLGKSYSYLI